MKKLFIVVIFALSVSCGRLPVPQPPSPPPLPVVQTVVSFDTVVCAVPAVNDHCDVPIVGATVKVDQQPAPYQQISNADGYNLWTVPSVLVDTFISIDVPGYTHFQSDTVHPADLAKQHNIFTLTSTWPQPVAGKALVLEPNDPSGLPCHSTQIVNIPSSTPAINFWRGDAWGTTIPGLPFVSGGSSKHPERALTWFFDRYGANSQTQILYAQRQRGYTHFVLSWPDSRDGNGQSVAQFVATASRVKQAIPYVAVFTTSKVYDSGKSVQQHLNDVTPVLDALVQAKAIDIIVVGWELDTFFSGQDLEAYIQALANRYPDLPLAVHFTSYKTSWQPDGQPRAQFWSFFRQVAGNRLIFLLYQGNQNDPCGLMQAHFNDAMVPASGLQAANAVLIPFELVAANEFDGDHPNEDDANARGWEVMNTPGPLLSSGFGNGARLPNGNRTLNGYAQ